MARITTADVARAAGVSRGTVSNVMNGDPNKLVTPATAARVRAAAESLGYSPSAAARLLRGGRSRTVLLLMPEIEEVSVQVDAMISSLSRALARKGFSLIWQLGVEGAPLPVTELSPAVVLTGPTAEDPAFARLASGFTVPVLPAFPGRDAFIAAAATAQVTYLAKRGHRKVAFAASSDPRLGSMVELRRNAVREACQAQGLELVAEVTWPDEPEPGVPVVKELVVTRRASAVCAFNDEIAMGVLAGASGAGIRVPRELSVIGVDDIRTARLAVPALTTVSADLSGFVDELSELLVQAAAGADVRPPDLPLNHRVIVRASA